MRLQPGAAPGVMEGLRGRLGRMALGGWIDRERMQADSDKAAASRDILRLPYLWAGMWFVFFIPWPMTFAELAVIPLLIVSVLRLSIIWRSVRWAFVQPLFFVLLAWMAYVGLSLLWSRDRQLGVEELGAIRFGVYGLLLFPLLARRGLLVGCLAAGLLVGNAAQFVNHVGVRWDVPRLVISHFEDRNGGWWPAVFGGQLLLGALGLHLPAAVMGAGKVRLVALACALVTLLGIFATGTRTAWIGAGIVIVLTIVVGICRGATRGARMRLGLGAIGAIVLAAAVIAATVGPEVSRRYDAAREEVRRALQEKDYDSDNGARLRMKAWACEAFERSPIIGHGIGSYPTFVKEHFADDGGAFRRFTEANHPHAHDAVLTVLADSGLVGLLFAMAATLIAFVGGAVGLTRQSLGTYAAGPLIAMAAMLTTIPFDAVHLNATTAKLLWVLTALCPVVRPRQMGSR